MYQLMNKDREVGRFDIISGDMGNTYPFECHNPEWLPIGFTYIEKWIEDRKASKHNAHLRKIMRDCGCEKTEGFIRLTHAASINDTFWIRNEKEDISWKKVSFYRNPFDETISRLAFEGLGLYGIQISSTSPELSTEGSFRKCWVREDDGNIYLYKRGSSGARNAGLEPYGEILAAEFARAFLKEQAVPYNLIQFHGDIASRCPLFTDERYGYVPASRFPVNHASPQALIQFYEQCGSEDQFRKMLILDAVTFNVDRHPGNHGMLIDNDTLKSVCMAPIFDLNMAMLPYIEEDDMMQIGTKLEEYGPRIGEDFTRIGQQAMTPQIRKSLIGLKGFEFSFRGDERFPEKRVHFLESLVNRQIEALLSRDILYTKDIFVPEIPSFPTKESITYSKPHYSVEPQNRMFSCPKQYETEAQDLFSKISPSRLFSCYDLELSPEGDPQMLLYPDGYKNVWIQINLNNRTCNLFCDGKETAILDIVLDQPKLVTGMAEVSKILKEQKH